MKNSDLPPTILVVDDTEELRNLLREILSTAGYQVREADSGMKALAAVAAGHPDLILLDIRLGGGMDGIEVCRRLMGFDETRLIPIILLSGFAEVNEWSEGLQLGAVDYVNKPFQAEELIARVRTHLDARQSQQALEQKADQLREANERLKAEIVARQRIEDDLRQSESLFRAITDNAATLIFMKDLGGLYLHVNSRFEELFHVSLAEVKGKTDFDLFSHDVATALTSNDQLVVRSEYHLEVEEQLQQDDGLHTYLSVKFPLKRESGEIYAVCGIATDITDRKRAEVEREELQLQLNRAQKMESIGILAGGIAHDFNNILGVILGFAEMVKDDAAPDSQSAKDLDKVLASAHRAKELVKQILAFSRQSAVELFPLKIQPLVKESLKMLRASIPTTIAIKENIHSQGGVVMADPTQVHQIVMNLCTNAFHAMEEKGGVLTVGVTSTVIDSPVFLDGRQMAPGEYVVLTVSDTGSGIDPVIMEKIFDPYFTTKVIGKGTGMGLSITHGIIKAYGGAISVESAVGQGTTFCIYLPVVREVAREPEQLPDAPSGKGRILFVDDEELLAEMGQYMLERLGYTVTVHVRSTDALDNFMKDPDQFDLVITDQTMPDMTGTDLARRLLQIRPDLPIILCTGFSQLVSEESVKAIGIRELALKPLSKSSIGNLIKRVITGRASG